jgi:hypothetical protein
MNIGSGGAYPSAATPTAPQGTPLSLNDATVRDKITDTGQNAQLSLSSLRGNTYRRFTIAADAVNYDIRTAFGNSGSGWNGTSKASADVVINGGVVVGTPNIGAYAMDTGAAGWPGPSTITIFNNGYIVGHGGNGGKGGDEPGSAGSGTNAGPALLARRGMTLVNGGIVGGGGGGGGGGDGASGSAVLFGNTVWYRNAGGAGGGGRTGRTPTPGGAGGNATGPGNKYDTNPGNPGTFDGAGLGKAGQDKGPKSASDGGPGGNWGSAGIAGSPAGNPGGAAGVAIQGWSVVTRPTGTSGIMGPTAG